jgi:ribosome recycling factor
MDIDEALLTAEDSMEKAIEYLKHEMRGIRTGRASPALVEFIKVDYYGSPTDLRSLALITVPEPTQILIKPFDAGSMQLVVKAIQTSGLGLNPMTEGKQIRLALPPLSGERRQQLSASIKQMGEQAKITVRNARRDANKHLDALKKDKSQHISEDDIQRAEEQTQDLLKKFEHSVEELVTAKMKEIQQF